ILACLFLPAPPPQPPALSLHDALPISNHRDIYKAEGWSRADIEAALWEALKRPASEVARGVGGVPVGVDPTLGDALVDKGIAERSDEHTSELQSREKLVCRLLLEKRNR